MKTPTVLTVSQLTTYIKAVFEENRVLSSVYLNGEISNFTNHIRSGHYYFSLKDENSVIRAVMFRTSNQRLRFTPRDGMKVLVRGRVSVFERDGAYQIYVDDMQPDGAGALAVAFEQLKQKLSAEGLFDGERKQPIPKIPERIGVITSPTGAAVRDILSILARRFPAADVVFCPVLVQGMGAPVQIVDAIRRFNRLQAADVLIVGRGGGSTEELWAFNDERLVRAVAESAIPVISAVGHETDFTLCDFAADLRAPTPSAAAELAVPDRSELLIQIRENYRRIGKAMQKQVQEERNRLERLRERRCFSSPQSLAESKRQWLDQLGARLYRAQKNRLERERLRWKATGERLESLSPLAVLLRGYAMVEKDAVPVTSVQQVQCGDAVHVRMSDGVLETVVKQIETGREPLGKAE